VGEAAKKKALDELAKAKIVLLDHTSGDPLTKGWIQGCNRVGVSLLFLSRTGKKKAKEKPRSDVRLFTKTMGNMGNFLFVTTVATAKEKMLRWGTLFSRLPR
jgi:hypothetical protein